MTRRRKKEEEAWERSAGGNGREEEMEGRRRKKKKFSVLECRIILWVFFSLYEVADCDWGAKKPPFTPHPKGSYSQQCEALGILKF
jgi:hypothetical protein